MSDYLNNLLMRSRSLAAEVRPRLAHPFETFDQAATAPALSPVVDGTAESDESRRAETSFVRNALEPPVPDTVSTASSIYASSPAHAQPPPPAMTLHDDEASARPGLARQRAQDGAASAESQSTAETFAEVGPTSRRDPLVQLNRAEPGINRPTQKSQPGLLHEQEARQAVGGRDERRGAPVALDGNFHRAEARVDNRRLDPKPAPRDEMPVSTLSVQTENPAGSTTTARQARAQTPTDIHSSLAGKVSTGEASSRQLEQRPTMIAPDVSRLENLAPTSNPPAAPTIRVTIGRIEVRAVMPPAMPAKEGRRTAPKLSLDEYLRSQKGGKR